MNTSTDVVFFGDSLTFGYGVKKEDSWVNKIIMKCNLKGINSGCNGDTTASMLSRYDKDVLSYNPYKIFIMAGTNDLLIGRSVKSIIENIELMIKDAISLNHKVVVGIPPVVLGSMAYLLFSQCSFYDYVEKELPILRSSLIELCSKHNISYIDFYNLTLNKPDLYLDGVHLNTAGNLSMYEASIDYFIK